MHGLGEQGWIRNLRVEGWGYLNGGVFALELEYHHTVTSSRHTAVVQYTISIHSLSKRNLYHQTIITMRFSIIALPALAGLVAAQVP
jgi:hypothetical protein